MKRSDKSVRFFEFIYKSGQIKIKLSKYDRQVTKTIQAEQIMDVRLLFDCENEKGRAFSLTVQNSCYTLVAYHSKEAECWVRIFHIVKEMNARAILVVNKNPLIFEKENLGDISVRRSFS